MDKKRNDRLNVPPSWIEYGASLSLDLHKAGILERMHQMSLAEIEEALANQQEKPYHRRAGI